MNWRERNRTPGLHMKNAELEQIVAAIAEGFLAEKAGTGSPALTARSSRTALALEPLASDASIAALIDHTILRPDAKAEEVRQVCAEARQYGFASVCVNPVWVA